MGIPATHLGRRLAATAAAAALLLATFAGTAAAATAPAAITGPVDTVGATTATITGTVNPNGSATTWSFEYGKTTSYGTSTAATSAGSGTSNTGVSANLSGLTPNTTYHYRLDATNGGGTTDGLDGIFTTAPGPNVVTGGASSVTTTSATLNGTVNANGRATTYYFEYGKTTGYGTKTPTQSAGSDTVPVSVSASISGLQAGQVYHFRVVATSDGGTTQGADASFKLTSTGSAPKVTTSAASALTTASAQLNGTVNPNGQSTTWYFDFGTTTSYGSMTPVASLGAGTKATHVTATVNGLPVGVYHFRLVATNAAGTTYGGDLTFGSGGPPVVQTGTTQGASTSAATLTGSVNSLGNPTTWYFQYGTTSSYGTRTPGKGAGSGTTPTGVSAAISKLAAGTTYHYRLVATSKAGTSYGSDVTFTTVPAVTLAASTFATVYGHDVSLSGTVGTLQAGVTVAVAAEPFGSTSSTTIGSVLTGAGGVWTYQTKPRIATVYQATVPGGSSTPAAVGVHPAVSLRVITKARFLTRVVASKSFAGKIVQLQRRLTSGRWVTVRRSRLNAKSSAVFAAKALPSGTSTIRVAMSVNQAGAGLLGGFSRTLVYKHR